MIENSTRPASASTLDLRVPGISISITGVVASILFGLLLLLRHDGGRKSKFPMFGRPQDVDFKGALTEGTKKSPTSAYMLPTTPPLTILPFHLMDKLKSVPESELSADQEIHRRALGQYTDLGTPIPALWDALKVDLTRHVRDLVPQLQKAAEYAFELHIAKERSAVREDGWIEVNGFVLIKRVVTVLNAVAFVGPKLAYDERWQKLAFGYSDDLRDAFDSLLRCPNWLRPFAHRFILRQIGFDRRRRLAVDLLTPLMQNIEGETTNLIGWIRKRLSHTQADDTMFMARMQLRAALASADSVSQALTNTIWDLATMVEYLPPIVEEIEQCVAQTTNGVWDMSTIDGMSKIDSLLREVGRVHSPFLVANGRITTSPLKLDDGNIVPKGTSVYFDLFSPHHSSKEQADTDVSVYDAFRYSKLREREGEPAKYLSVTTGPGNLRFGHGNRSCPGRWFAVAHMKILLAYFVLKYDFKLVGDERPTTGYSGFHGYIDRSAKLLIRPKNVVS